MNTRLILGGIKSYLPIQIKSYKGTGGSTTGEYCYSVWLRHLSIIKHHLPDFRPGVVVELGPGDSVGLGLAALLTGSDRYVGLDVVVRAAESGTITGRLAIWPGELSAADVPITSTGSLSRSTNRCWTKLAWI